MSDAVVGVTQGTSPDRLIDNESLTVGANTVYRQRLEVTGAAAAEIARVENAQPGTSDYGLVVRNIPTGTQAMSAADGSSVALGATTDTSSALTVIGRLKALIAQIPAALGRTTMAGSLSVTLASDQPNLATSAADGTNVTLGTTTDTASASTVIGRLKAIVAQLPAALGRTTMANSLSVTIASDQANVPVNNAQVSGTATDVNTGAPTAGTQRVVIATPATVLAGYSSFTSTTAATTLVTIPQGKTWTGTVAVSAACGETAAGTAVPQALGIISVAGTNVVPAAGNYFGVEALAGANAATGTVGDGGSNFGSLPMIVVAPAGNSVTIQVTVTVVGSAGRIDASAFGTTV